MFGDMFRRKSLGASVVLFIVLLIAPLIIPKFYTYILAVIFTTALLAMSLNLVVGHGGLFQFHHAAFYGVGAYTSALLAKAGAPLPLAVAAMQACEFVGLPECQLTLAQTVTYLACAPKSNAATTAIAAARNPLVTPPSLRSPGGRAVSVASARTGRPESG